MCVLQLEGRNTGVEAERSADWVCVELTVGGGIKAMFRCSVGSQ